VGIYRPKYKGANGKMIESPTYWIDVRCKRVKGGRIRRPVVSIDDVGKKAALKAATDAYCALKVKVAAPDFDPATIDAMFSTDQGVDFGKALTLYMESRLDAGHKAESYHYLQHPPKKTKRVQVKPEDRIETWGDVFEGRSVATIATKEIEDTLRRWRTERGWSPASRNLAVSQVAGLFSYCVRREWIDRNPASSVRIERLAVQNERKRWLALHEIETLAAKALERGADGEAPNAWIEPMIRFACMSGMRLGEVCGLRRADYRMDASGEPVLVIAKTKNGDPLTWPVEGDARILIETQIEGTRFPADYLFPGPRGGNARSSIKRTLQTVVEKAELHYGRQHEDGITFHVFRHTMATQAFANGVPDAVTQMMGNWKTPRMLARYRKIAPANLRAGARLLANVVTLGSRSGQSVVTMKKSALVSGGAEGDRTLDLMTASGSGNEESAPLQDLTSHQSPDSRQSRSKRGQSEPLG
jgi:integrase